MTNAARELADLLETLCPAPTGESVFATRERELTSSGTVDFDELDFWRHQGDLHRAVERFEALMDHLAKSGRSVESYRKDVANYYAYVWMPRTRWFVPEAREQGEFIGEDELVRLRLVADVVDALGESAVLQASRMQDVLQRLIELRDLVESIDSQDMARQHLLWQIDLALKMAGAVGHFGETAASESVATVVEEAAAYAESDDLEEPTRSRLRTATREVAISAFGRVMAQGALEGGEAVIKAIGLG
ncbi:hypothetical protein [Nocardioides sp. 503]|uniref:hypothetical protein n=1 Tax=Nocardioides sp. 503 TaxID=2508326 RepID=UPI00106FF6E4|nr:hypothetical protein [Nocardioides sp. 503]